MEFHWAIRGEIAVGSLPENQRDVQRLAAQGIAAVISLHAVSSAVAGALSKAGMKHLPAQMPDMSAPGFEQMTQLAAIIDNFARQGQPVFIHCYMGRGRCRTVACAYLAQKLSSADDAFEMVGSPETSRQREFVRQYAATAGTAE